MQRLGSLVIALLAAASPGLGQGFNFDELDAVVDTQTGALEFTLPVLGPVVSNPTLGVAEADVVGSTAPEVLFHDATTIRWFDGASIPPSTGVFQPSPPVAIMALVGTRTSATVTPFLFALASNGSDLYSLDLAAVANGWIGPSPLGFVATSMTAVDVVGSSDEDQVLTDGTNVAAFDGATGYRIKSGTHFDKPDPTLAKAARRCRSRIRPRSPSNALVPVIPINGVLTVTEP